MLLSAMFQLASISCAGCDGVSTGRRQSAERASPRNAAVAGHGRAIHDADGAAPSMLQAIVCGTRSGRLRRFGGDNRRPPIIASSSSKA